MHRNTVIFNGLLVVAAIAIGQCMGCTLNATSDLARFTRIEAAVDSKADASRADSALRTIQQQMLQDAGRLNELTGRVQALEPKATK